MNLARARVDDQGVLTNPYNDHVVVALAGLAVGVFDAQGPVPVLVFAAAVAERTFEHQLSRTSEPHPALYRFFEPVTRT